jgi:peptide/nickel transport system permease protein
VDRSWGDDLAVLDFSTAAFWLAFILPIYAFTMRPSLPPVQGYGQLSQGLLPFLKHLILPAVTLSLNHTILIAWMTRANMLEILQGDYIGTTHAGGARSWPALENAALPVATIIGVGFALLIGGAVVEESVFPLRRWVDRR